MRRFAVCSLSLLPLLVGPLCGQDPAAVAESTTVPSDFVRFVPDDAGGGHLDTAITTYRKGDVEVVLFGAVHIADVACYQVLNDRFTDCDVLLYELIAESDVRPTRERDTGFNPIAMLQQGLKNSLELSFQLEEIDYQADNFVHADMTPAEFAASMAERGESLLSLMFDMMANGMRVQREAAEAAEDGDAARAPASVDLVKAFRSGEGRHTLRMTFASQLEQMEMMLAGGEGSTLLEGRNEKCLEVLQRELQNGHDRIGIYYGAAHLPHMERRLVEDLGFRKVGHEWLQAWDCTKRPDPKLDRELLQQRRQARSELAELARAGRDLRQAESPREVPSPQQLLERELDGKRAYGGPLQDPWGNDYLLRRRPRGTRWEAVSPGPDGRVGTDDDLVVPEPRRGGLRDR